MLNLQKPASRAQDRREKKCGFCGLGFKPRPADRHNPEGRFCSLKCARRGTTAPLSTRFWSSVSRPDGDGCWMWTGSKNPSGYGTIAAKSLGWPMPLRAHRVSWELNHGPIPTGMWVLHKCDNPSCVRPDHLFLGTRTDNMRDAANKGRLNCQQPTFRRQTGRTLTRETAEKVKRLRAAGSTYGQIVKLLGVTKSAVACVCQGRTWV